MIKYKDILVVLPSLTKAQLLELQTKINFLVGVTSTSSIDLPENMKLFYSSLIKAFDKRGVRSPPISAFLKSKDAKAFQEQFIVVETFISDNFKGLSKIQTQRVFDLLAELIISNMTEFTNHCSMGLIARNINRIPNLFEASFPGYISSGVAKALLGD